MRLRLSVLMFLQFAACGAMVPLFSLRLTELGFTPAETGLACATQALAALIAPLLVGQIADRWFPAERCLAVCSLTASGLLWVLADLTEPVSVVLVTQAFWLVMVPAFTLGTSLSFAHLAEPRRDYGPVRMWGTVGWVVPGWLLGYWLSNPEWLMELVRSVAPSRTAGSLADAFRLGGVFAFVLGLYALTLPHTPPLRHPGISWLAPLAALRLLRGRGFAFLALGTFGVCLTMPFVTQINPLFLEHLGIPRPLIQPTLTIGQGTEMLGLLMLPLLLSRFGQQATMRFGVTAWVLALAVLTLGQPTGLVVASLGLGGLCVCCFLVAGQVYVNSRASADVRASAQALLTFVTGMGALAGNLVAGWVRGLMGGEFRPTYAVGAALAVSTALVFFLGFNDDPHLTPSLGEVAAADATDPLTVPTLAPTAASLDER